MKGQSLQNIWMLVLLLLAGIVLGGFIGEYMGTIPILSWLGYGMDFGLTTPLTLDLGVLKLQFGCSVHFTIAGIVGIIVAILIYKKLI